MRFAFSPFFAAIFRQKAADERTDKSRINERLPEGLEGGAVGRPKTTFKRVILLSLTVIGFGLGVGLDFAYLGAAKYPLQTVSPGPFDEGIDQTATSVAQETSRGSTEDNVPRVSNNTYSRCVIEALKAKDAAAQGEKEKFVAALSDLPSFEMLEMMRSMEPSESPDQTIAAQNESIARLKELCRLRFPCAKTEVVSNDYDRCIKRLE